MRLTNVSGLAAAWTSGFAADGRELLVVMAKATFTLPVGREAAALANEQVRLTQADTFTGEPGSSAIDQPTDYVHHKPGCDVLLMGSAYAPSGRRTARSVVGLRVGAMVKQFDVVGPRRWQGMVAAATRPSSPEPFDRLPIGYDHAFGGVDRTHEDDGRIEGYRRNPVGRSYWPHRRDVAGEPLPYTEASGEPITDPRGTYRPMSFAPIGRDWLPRSTYAGTYDDAWRRNRAPLWPADFNPRYFHAAPPDQILPAMHGGEDVVLSNLTPDGLRRFRLPAHPVPMLMIPHRGHHRNLDVRIDTLLIEPDAERFTMTWRATVPMARSIFDVREVVVGDPSLASVRARHSPGKKHYPGLGALVADREKGERR